MDALRRSAWLARWVLVWFALSLGAAIASPLVKPQAMELVCSGTGAVKLLIKTDDGVGTVASHTLDCPLCASLAAPPPAPRSHVQAVPALAYRLRSILAAHIASLTAAPLPARGPPTFS